VAVSNATVKLSSQKIKDWFFLIGSALLVCAVFGGAFLITEIHHLSPAWVFLGGMSIPFVAFAFEEYRRKFRSVRFRIFVCVWVVINLAVVVFVLGYLGWLYLVLALVLEQFLFYMTAYWLFHIHPSSFRR
jgi:hypothetical protein